MREYELLECLDMRQILIFLNSANTGSFSKTAKKMFMSQSMVSKNIAAMERNLGIQIFRRNSQGIELTPAGLVLYQEWKGLIYNMDQAVSKAIVAQGESKSQLFICDFYTSVNKEYFWPFVDKFKATQPDVDIVLETVEPCKVLDRLENKTCDIAFVPMCEMPDFKEAGIGYKVALTSRRCAWVHKSNQLAKKNQISLVDLKNETFIVVTANHAKSVINMCESAGFRPQKIIHSANVNSATMDVKMGKGIIIRDMVFDNANMDEIKVFEIPDTESGTIIAWRRDTTNENVRRFISLY